MQNTANKRASQYIASNQAFKANNIFAEWESLNIYSVYSYGYHFPLYVYVKDLNKWYENKDKYSITTSKHKSQCRINVDYIGLNTQNLKELINKDNI